MDTTAAILAIFLACGLLPLLCSRPYQSLWQYLLACVLTVFILSYSNSTFLTILSSTSTGSWIFITLFLFRYIRLVVHIVGFCSYKPTAVSANPNLQSTDVTVIIPSVEAFGNDFRECIQSVAANEPASIIIVTAGPDTYKKAIESVGTDPRVTIKHCNVQNKRRQVSLALQEVTTKITVLCDDHVFWPFNFLPKLIAPFEDENVGCVGTRKRVRRTSTEFSFQSFWNLLGCLYLERHNSEIAATNQIDGGVFVVSGRTSAHRSHILKPQSFQDAFTNEYLLFGRVGPLNADDDNFITRWMVEHNWKIKIQYSESACMETTLGEYPKFLSQCLRWSRTTWRSNPRSLLSLRTWKTQPWCIYAVYLTSLFNFALLYDPLLLYTFRASNLPIDKKWGTLALCLWILASKLVKPYPHFRQHPGDLVYLPGCILFGYAHSLIKLYALVTFWDVAWGGRTLSAEEEEGEAVLETPKEEDIGHRMIDTDGEAALNMHEEGDTDIMADSASGEAAVESGTETGMSTAVKDQ